MNPKGPFSFVFSDSTKEQTSSLNQEDSLMKTFTTKSRSLEIFFVRMEERKKIEQHKFFPNELFLTKQMLNKNS